MRFFNKVEIYQKWVNCMKSVSKKSSNQWSSIVLDKNLVLFAFKYASKQVDAIKDRIGTVPYSTLENIFYNKLAEMALCIYSTGTSSASILQGKSHVPLSHVNKDERYKSSLTPIINGHPSIVAGTIKYTYPIVNRYPVSNHAIIYIDAKKPDAAQMFPFANITDGLKVTLLGCATPCVILNNNDNALSTAYSNSQTSFYGFENIESFCNISWNTSDNHTVPEYVHEIANLNDKDLDRELDKVKFTLSSRACPASNNDIIDFSKLFDPIINSSYNKRTNP